MRAVLGILGSIADCVVKVIVTILWILRVMIPGNAMVDHAIMQNRVDEYEMMREIDRRRARRDAKKHRDRAP
jgi:hypothetical protein